MKTIPVSLIIAGIFMPLASQAQPQGGPDRQGFGRKGGEARPFPDLWKAADSDQDGFISREEFAAMPRVRNLPEEKRSHLFERLDKDGDGRIGRDEIARLGRQQDGKRPPFQRLWELDTDRSGGVSFAEFKKGKLFMKLPPERQMEVFKRLDTDGDGQITAKDRPQAPRPRDFDKPRGKRPPGPPMDGRGRPGGAPDRPGMERPGMPLGGSPATPEKERKRGPRAITRKAGKMPEPSAQASEQMIRQFDKDADGALSFEEFRNMPALKELGEDDQEDHFEAWDRNKDLKISAEDFRD